MKWMGKLLMMALMCVCVALAVPMTNAEAYVIEEVDGVSCYHGDLNYPLWETGSKLGSVFDISSAFIEDENDSYAYIKVNEYMVHYETDYLSLDGAREIRYNKRLGQFAFQGADGWFDPFARYPYQRILLNHALYLIRAKFGM